MGEVAAEEATAAEATAAEATLEATDTEGVGTVDTMDTIRATVEGLTTTMALSGFIHTIGPRFRRDHVTRMACVLKTAFATCNSATVFQIRSSDPRASRMRWSALQEK